MKYDNDGRSLRHFTRRHFMKKSGILMITVLILAALLSGCGKTEKQSGNAGASAPVIDTTSEYTLLQDIVKQIRKKTDFTPKVGIVLGSGLSSIADRMEPVAIISYSDINGLPISTAPGHVGQYVFGYLEGVPVVFMQGRVHCYEGYSSLQVVRPIRVMKLLGAETLILTNSSGAVNMDFRGGEIAMITDQLIYGVENPLKGANIDELGDRFPDMKDLYDSSLQKLLRESAKETGINLKEGVYVQDSGPSYETVAEVRMLRSLGADMVGMSTAIEALTARHMGMQVCGLSCVTVAPADASDIELNEDFVNAQADAQTETMYQLIRAFIRKLGK